MKDVIDKNSPNLMLSPNISKYITSNIKVLSYQTVMIELARKGKIKEALDILKENSPQKYLKSHKSYEKSLMGLFLKATGATLKFNFKDFNNIPS